MRVVWKYQLLPGINVIPLPEGSDILAVAPWEPGADGPAIWIERERDGSLLGGVLKVAAVGTGHDVPEGGRHLGSAWCGPFMWHVYRLPL